LAQKGGWTRAIVEYQSAGDQSQLCLMHVKLEKALFKRAEDEHCADRKAWKSDPNDTLAYNDLGLVMIQRGKWIKAMAQYEKALQIAPNLRWLIIISGAALFRSGQVAERSSIIKGIGNQSDTAQITTILALRWLRWA